MRLILQEYNKSYQTCQKIKTRNHKLYGLLQPIEPPKGQWVVIMMDIVLRPPVMKNGNSGILRVVDKLSKMIRIIPIKSIITPQRQPWNSRNTYTEIVDYQAKSSWWLIYEQIRESFTFVVG